VLDTLPLASGLLAAHAPLLDDPLQVISDPVGWIQSWLWPAIFGKDTAAQQNWVGTLFSDAFHFTGLEAPPSCSASGGGSCTTFSIWTALQATGYLVLAMSLMLRMLRNMVDPSKRPVAKWLVFDVIVRGAFSVLAINVSYAVLSTLMHSSIVIGNALFDTIMSVTTAQFAGQAGMAAGVAAIMSPANLPIPLILETLAVLYLTMLILASRVAIIFAIAIAPLVIPVYAYSGQGWLILWWGRLLVQGLMVPVVMGALFAIALVVIQAVNSVNAGMITPLLGTVTAVVSLWFVGHAIGRLLGTIFPEHRGFSAGANTVQGRAGFVRGRIGSAFAPATSLIRR
jgi:hypothetical protein